MCILSVVPVRIYRAACSNENRRRRGVQTPAACSNENRRRMGVQTPGACSNENRRLTGVQTPAACSRMRIGGLGECKLRPPVPIRTDG